MGALRINLTDGTSQYIDLTSAVGVNVVSSNPQEFVINVQDSAGSTNYDVKRFGTKNPEDGSGEINVVWECQMLVAYTAISLNPIRYGYPDLGDDPFTYTQYDDEKFLAEAIASALSNTGEPAVLSNRTARAHTITTCDDAKAIVEEMENIYDACRTEATTTKDACVKAVNDPGCTAPGFDVSNPGSPAVYCPCLDAACCEANENIYKRNCVNNFLDTLPIRWDHQYIFAIESEEP